MQIYAIRHGATDDNKRGVLQGQRLNAGMNEEGKAQARVGIEGLLESNPPGFSSLYSSPLLRTRQTADIAKDYFDLKIASSDHLLERDFGTLSGMSWEKIEREYDSELKRLDKALQFDYQPFGGESAEQVRERVLEFIDDAKDLRGDAILISTHGGTLRIFYDVLTLEQPDHIENGSVHVFDV